MTRITACFWILSACVLWPGAAGAQLNQPDLFENEPTLKALSAEQVQDQVAAWLVRANVDPLARASIEAMWQSQLAADSGLDLLELVAQSVAVADDRAAALVRLCGGAKPLRIPDQSWLDTPKVDPWVRDNLRLYYGRWLAQQALYDESLDQLAGLNPEQAIDPASLLFYKSVVCHWLLQKTEGLKAINRLLTDVQHSPQRYLALAGLMREDLQALKDESLDHIARRMDDIERRLDLARAGRKVRDIEDGVIASLDKLIKEEEERQQQQSGSGSGSGGSQQPKSPMPDSRLARAQGAGDVDRSDVGNASGWGDLPARKREEALQQIGKEFPAHYRDAIEQYFRKLATEGSERTGP